MAERIPIILDTDIADDIDDAAALAFALGSPEFELLGVTVVYGDVVTRAKVARRMVAAAGRDVPVLAGWARPLGYRWRPGAAPVACSQASAAAGDEAPVRRGAAEFIAETVRRRPGEVHVLTIGAMTNAAAAVCSDEDVAGLLAGVVSLAGYAPPREGRPEWNVRYDPQAAQVLAACGAPWTAIGGDVQGDSGLTPAEFGALAAAGGPVSDLLLELIVLMKRNKMDNPDVKGIEDVSGIHVADVMTLASFLVPERMDLRRGRAEVDDAGAMGFAPDASGPHRMAFGRLSGGDYRAEIVRRVLAANP